MFLSLACLHEGDGIFHEGRGSNICGSGLVGAERVEDGRCARDKTKISWTFCHGFLHDSRGKVIKWRRVIIIIVIQEVALALDSLNKIS